MIAIEPVVQKKYMTMVKVYDNDDNGADINNDTRS